MTVRYQADDPKIVAREADVGGGGAVVLAVLSDGISLLFLLVSAVAAVFVVRQWLAAPRPGRTPQDGQRHDGDEAEPLGT
ncbi:hypothetical protein ACK8N7_26650 [Streptomyces griseobrunneus]|uniref:hypothetical protein n=1 Tax=Streptomyces microflavus TaxID=1919 RepID=UPI0037FE99AD